MSADHGYGQDHGGDGSDRGGYGGEQGYQGPPPSGPAVPTGARQPYPPAGQPWAGPGPAGPPPPYPPAGQPWGPQPWGAQPWGQQPWGPQPWGGQPGWGPHPGSWTPPPPPPPAWPRGPGRPQQAGTAGVLAFVAGGTGIMWGLVALVLLAGSDGGTSSWLGLVVGLPAGVALLVGGARLQAGTERWTVVVGGGLLAAVVLVQALVSAADSYGSSFGQAMLVVFLLPVPVCAAVLAALPVVGGWVAHVRSGRSSADPAPTATAPPAW